MYIALAYLLHIEAETRGSPAVSRSTYPVCRATRAGATSEKRPERAPVSAPPWASEGQNPPKISRDPLQMIEAAAAGPSHSCSHAEDAPPHRQRAQGLPRGHAGDPRA